MANTNNPPDVVLELTKEEAEFLRDNTEASIVFALNAMQNVEMREEALRKLVGMMELHKSLRDKLRKAMAS